MVICTEIRYGDALILQFYRMCNYMSIYMVDYCFQNYNLIMQEFKEFAGVIEVLK
jgi:hypothetical protein